MPFLYPQLITITEGEILKLQIQAQSFLYMYLKMATLISNESLVNDMISSLKSPFDQAKQRLFSYKF